MTPDSLYNQNTSLDVRHKETTKSNFIGKIRLKKQVIKEESIYLQVVQTVHISTKLYEVQDQKSISHILKSLTI